MKNADLLKRIEQLEARVRELEARPVYVPVPYSPQPWASPGWPYPHTTCGIGVGGTC